MITLEELLDVFELAILKYNKLNNDYLPISEELKIADKELKEARQAIIDFYNEV